MEKTALWALIEQHMKPHLYGSIEIKFQDGEPYLVECRETIKIPATHGTTGARNLGDPGGEKAVQSIAYKNRR